MTDNIAVSAPLRQWAHAAGHELTPRCADGRAMFWNVGGEIRYFVAARDDGWYAVTDSERGGPEQLVLLAAALPVVEKYFVGRFGRALRRRRGLPDLPAVAVQDVAAGFAVTRYDLAGKPCRGLADADGNLIAVSAAGALMGAREMVRLSTYLTRPLDQLMAAFDHPDGAPLFSPPHDETAPITPTAPPPAEQDLVALIARDADVAGVANWDRYVYFMYVGSAMTSSSGFGYTGNRWTPHGVHDTTESQIRAGLARLRDAAAGEKWNAAAIVYDRRTGIGNLHFFYGSAAEEWAITPANQSRVAAHGLALFDRDQHPADAPIAAVIAYIRGAGLDYPTAGLRADRFEAGWSVYAPVEVDTSDPMAFLDMPVGRATYLIGDSGRIEQVSSSVPPREARARFAEQERALARQAAAAEFTAFDHPPAPDPQVARRNEQIAERAAAMLHPIVGELATLGPPGWIQFTAVFALTVRAASAQCRFVTADGVLPVDVPYSIVELVRAQRAHSADMSAGPWWRLTMTVTSDGQLTVTYDYGDDPFPDGQLQPAENYRADIAAYPRPELPVWLAGYVIGPAAQGRTPAQAADAASTDRAAGSMPVDTDDIEPLSDTWARWAMLSAVYVGARSQWGPRITPGLASYESDARSGATLYLLPGDRAVLSGGRWNSPLLVASYQRHEPLPDLYAGAPDWVNDTVLNTRNQNGLLTFCYWWAEGRWWRGGTDTFDELDDPLPVIWTPDETVAAMTTVVGTAARDACARLLSAATARAVTRDQMAAVFAEFGDPDIDGAVNQLGLAGLTAPTRPPTRRPALQFQDSYFSREDRYSLGIETTSGRYYAAIPVSNGAVDYEEAYELTPAQYHAFLRDTAAAIDFVAACRRRENDRLLFHQPGTRRGTPV